DETAGEPAGEAVDEPAAEIPAAREAPAAPQPSQEELARKYAAAPPAGDGQEPAARPAPASDDAMQEAAEPGDAPTGADVAEDEAPATEREVAAADPEADVETQPTAGRIVVQPGNNLWRISRVIYGKGVRYTIIYSANADQIRDPNLIYPGQIFVTPGIVPPEVIEPDRREPLVDAAPELHEGYVTEYDGMHRELMRRR